VKTTRTILVTVALAATPACATDGLDSLEDEDAAEDIVDAERAIDDSSEYSGEPEHSLDTGNDVANAPGDCPWYAVCGDVYNRSGGHQIRVSNHWCKPGFQFEGDILGCASEIEVPNGRDADDYTGFGDTDAIRFYRGCSVSGYVYVVGAPDLIFFTYDRRGRNSLWVKITDIEDYTITSITCG
jgi:hypothetical protein